jgi:hypothetical protein
MNCTICEKPIVLVPSAQERARKDMAGHPASYYIKLFTTHTACFLRKRKEETSALMKRIREQQAHDTVVVNLM